METLVGTSNARLEPLGQAQHRAIGACYDHWCHLRRQSGRTLPGRQHVDPAEMAAFLPHVILFDVERRGAHLRFRHRLTGTHFAEIFGRDVTGMYIEHTGSLESFDDVYRRFSAIAEDKVGAYGVAPSPVRDRDYLYYEHLTLPLASDGEIVDMLFGVRCILPSRSRPVVGYVEFSLLDRS